MKKKQDSNEKKAEDKTTSVEGKWWGLLKQQSVESAGQTQFLTLLKFEKYDGAGKTE